MSFLKALFGGKVNTPEEEKQEQENKQFDTLKYDGIRALHTGEAEFAVKCLEHALQLQDDFETHDYLSQAYVASGDVEKACQQMQLLADAHPDNATVLLRLAELSYMNDDFDSMADACNRAIETDKDNVVAHYLKARACVGKDDVVGAVAMLTKTISLDETFASAYLLRAQTLLDAGDTDSAEADINWLTSNIEPDEDVLTLKARLEHRKGNLDAAIATYDKVIELNPFSAVAYRERGALRLQKGDKEGAEADMRQLLEIEPQAAHDVNGEFTNSHSENIQQQVEQAYRNSNPFGL